LPGALQLKNLTSTLANCSGLISSACNASAMVQPSSTIISGQLKLRKKILKNFHERLKMMQVSVLVRILADKSLSPQKNPKPTFSKF
jgi:hypothetical protein